MQGIFVGKKKREKTTEGSRFVGEEGGREADFDEESKQTKKMRLLDERRSQTQPKRRKNNN